MIFSIRVWEFEIKMDLNLSLFIIVSRESALMALVILHIKTLAVTIVGIIETVIG